MLFVTNWGVQQPSVRWQQQRETLEAPPLVLDDEVVHANSDGIFAINSLSGELEWDYEVEHVIQVPVGNEQYIIGNTGHGLVAVDRSTGDVQWEAEFDLSADEIIDSRVTLDGDHAYVGLRSGAVVELSMASGDRTVLCEYESSVVGLCNIEPGLIAMTRDGGVYLIDSTGSAEWPEEADFVPWIKHVQDGTVYASTGDSLLALTEGDGTVKWEIEFPSVEHLIQTGDTVVAPTRSELIAVDAETGTREWKQSLTDNFGNISNPVVVNGTLACVTSAKIVDEEFYSFDRNLLHMFDPADGTELQEFELGVGDCYGLSVVDDTIVCSAGNELICLEEFPESAR